MKAMYLLLGISIYVAVVLGIVFFSSYKRTVSSSEFIIGDRSLNAWLTALAAHASDMSNWLFMGYPALIFSKGLFHSWVAIGLILCMQINWKLIAPKLRILTQQMNCSTISGFFEKKLGDDTSKTRIFSAVICMAFYMVYIAAGLVGIGVLTNSLFGIHYTVGLAIGVFIIFAYVIIGGYRTLAHLDFFQGLFLLSVIVFVPVYIVLKVNKGAFFDSETSVISSIHHLLPDFSSSTILSICSMTLGWGLGYFGQPHILTKFMGIKSPQMITRSKYIGLSWMVVSLFAATAIGVVGTKLFKNGLGNPELIFIEMVKGSFHPFFIGLVLCALIAAIFNVVSAQILVLSSVFVEDIYKPFINRKASDRQLLLASRIGIVIIGILAFGIAYGNWSSIYTLVFYAWSGLGAAFGPVLLYTLYAKEPSKEGAWIGMCLGAVLAGIWPYINSFLPVQFFPILPAFFLNLLCNWGITQFVSRRNRKMELSV